MGDRQSSQAKGHEKKLSQPSCLDAPGKHDMGQPMKKDYAFTRLVVEMGASLLVGSGCGLNQPFGCTLSRTLLDWLIAFQLLKHLSYNAAVAVE